MTELQDLSDEQLTAMATELAGAAPGFAPLDSDADCFVLLTRFKGLQVDQIVRDAHASYHQLDLVRKYVRRNVVRAVVRIALMKPEDRYEFGW